MKPKIFVITGSSGVGKSTIADALLLKNKNLKKVITCTTRAPRGKEKDGVDSRFLSVEKFKALIEKKAFFENALVYGNYYGSLKEDVKKILASKKSLLFVVDVQGAETIKKNDSRAVTIFIKPPKFEELRARLKKRKTDSEEIIDKRIAVAKEELKKAPLFDYAVVNDLLDVAVKETQQIVEKESKA
ncbi:MAG: guanylate kinase [archaeon]